MPFIAKTKFTRKLTLFLKVFLVILFSVLLLYYAFAYMYMESVKAANAENLNKTVSNYMYAVQYARSVANQIYIDFSREKYLMETDDPVRQFSYITKLKRYLATTQHLESFVLISNGKLYHIGAFQSDEETRELIRRCQDVSEPIWRENHFGDSLVSTACVYSLVYAESSNENGEVENGILLNLNERWAEQFAAGGSNNQQVFAFNDQDELLLSTLPSSEYHELESSLLRAVHDKKSFGKLKDANGEKTSYYITVSSSEGKSFAILTKEENFAKAFRKTLLIAALVSLGFCVLMLLAVLIYSQYSLMMIRQMKQQLLQSENRYQSSKEKLKANYLSELLHSEGEENALRAENPEEYGITLHPETQIRLFLIEPDHAKESEKSRYLMRKADELAESLWKRNGKGEWLRINRTMSLYISEFAEDDICQNMAEAFQSAFYEQTQHSLSVFISRKGSFREISSLFSELLYAKKEKFVLGFGCVVFANGSLVPSETDMSFYYTAEQNIQNAIRLAQTAKAAELFSEFLQSDFVRKNIADISEIVKKMLFSFYLELRKNGGEEKNLLFREIDGVETSDEAKALLRHMLESTRKKPTEIDSKKKLVQKVEDYIDTNYADSNLSVSSIAEYVGLSSGYLGQIYKRERNRGVGDYINAKRMETAKFLIETTSEPIMEIAAKVGITNKTHFYKLFQKYYNATPSGFRKS